MKTIHQILFILILLIFFGVCNVKANKQVFYSTPEDSIIKHELIITPAIGYGELSFLETHLADALYYNNIHYHTASLAFGCSLDYLLTSELLIGLEANYQTLPFSSLNIEQLYYYNYVSNPYVCIKIPELGCSVDYLESDNTSIGLRVSYQTIQWTSTGQQSFYPDGLQFSCLNFGLQTLYYFEGRNRGTLDYYIGGRIDLSIWAEKDSWANGNSNSQYIPIIVSSSNNLVGVNDLQLSLLFYGGMRYFLSPTFGIHLEVGFGFGSPYYSECGFVLRLNHKH
jgi:hypothetical protein